MANKDTTFVSEKRRAKRILAPVGTMALIKDGTGSMYRAGVRDISVVGILIYGYTSGGVYPVNTLIKNIFIDIPPCKLWNTMKVCLLIDTGKVVRSFFDQISKTFCYGIELENDSSYMKGKLENLIHNN